MINNQTSNLLNLNILYKIVNKTNNSNQSKAQLIFIFVNLTNLNHKKINPQWFNYHRFKHTTKSKKFITTKVFSEIKIYIQTDTNTKRKNKLIKKQKVI